MKILYPQDTGQIAIIIPVANNMTIEQIAAKDVPFGKPYLIVKDSDLPTDWETSAAWEADFSNPDGIGIGPQRWFIAQAEAAITEIGTRTPPFAPETTQAVHFDEFPFAEDADKEAVYTQYLEAVALENQRKVTRHEADVAAFEARNAAEIAAQNQLIEQMKAEVFQLEGAPM